jgi:hypothetical protein
MCLSSMGLSYVETVAAVLKEALPDATNLVRAFDAGGSMSRGAARTLRNRSDSGVRLLTPRRCGWRVDVY